MTKKHSTKRALISSVVMLALCFSMLVGTTFAWFTDSVTSSGNIIKTGTLDVEMYWADGEEAIPTADAGWKDASEGAIFYSMLWEPGFVQVRHIKIANKGSLALKYKVSIVANGEVSDLSDVIDVYYLDPAAQIADRTELVAEKRLGTLTEVLAALNATGEGELIAGASDTITIALKMQESAGNDYQNKSIGTDFSIQLVATQLASEDDSFNNQYDKDATYPLVSVPATLPSDPADVADDHKFETEHAEVAVDAETIKDIVEGTEAESLALSHSEPKIDATANTVTFDNFDIVDENNKPVDLKALGNTTPITVIIDLGGAIAAGKTVVVYHDGEAIASAVVDAEGCITYTTTHFCEVVAAVGGGEANNAYELNAAIANGEPVALKSNLEVSSTIVIPEGVNAVIDLNGYTITGDMPKSVGAVVTNNGSLVIKNGTISSTAGNGGSAIVNNGTLVAEDLTLNGAPNEGDGWPSYTVNNTGVLTATDVLITSYHGAICSYGEGAVATLNNCEIDMAGIDGFSSHGMYTYNNGSIVVNGGTYANKNTTQAATGASVINGAVTVNAGTISGRIENYYGTPVIKGGTFDNNPSKYIAEGYMLADNGDGTYSVVVDPAYGNAAKIGDVYYKTLEEAMESANNGDTVVVIDDVSNFEADIKKDITLDLGGNTIADAYIKVDANVILQNGSVKNTNEPYPLVVESGSLTVNDVAIEASKSDRAIWVRAGKLVFNSGSILATKGENNTTTNLIAAIYIDTNTEVVINGGTIVVDTPDNNANGIYGNYKNANVTVNGGKISTSGKNYSYAIRVDGDITVNGGEIVTNEKRYGYSSGIAYGKNYALCSALGDVTVTGGSFTTNGYSGYIVNVGRTYSSNEQTVSITGGTFKNVLSEIDKSNGGHNAPVLICEGSASTVTATITGGSFSGFSADLLKKKCETTTLTVSGGTFDVAISDFIADGYQLADNENGTWTVMKPRSGKVAYRAYVKNDSRKAIQIDMENIYAEESFVVELWHNGTLLTTTTYAGKYPYEKAGYTTCAVAMPGSAFASWDTVIADGVTLTADNVPDTIKLYADGILVDTFTHSSGTILADKVNDYLAMIAE